MSMRPLVVATDEGDPIPGTPFVRKVGPEVTGGRVSILQVTMAPGELVDPHTHTREDEVTYVVSGTVGALMGSHEVAVPQGAFLLKPRDIPHAMWNSTDEPAVLLEIITPSGFEEFFAEVGQIFAQRPPEPGEIERLAASYGETFHRDRSDELIKRHDLRRR